jgi:[acyl-carrier-protein] S-malonyltransferase
MGAELRETNPDLYERYLAQADEVSGLPIRTYSLDGPIESLTETNVAQPALYTLSLALLELARESGLRPDFVAGHSLGEYTAAAASGALSFGDGLRLVSERGRLMAAAQSERPGTMAAVIGLDAERLDAICGEASVRGIVAAANVNTPTQIVVSGEEEAVLEAMRLAEEAGADKVVRLQVGAAFHSELMKPVQERMRAAMEDVTFADPEIPLASNASARLVTTADDVREALIAQIASRVRWVECVRALEGAGCTTYLEIGSGRVLGGLVKQILGMETDVASVDSPGKLESFAASREDAART